MVVPGHGCAGLLLPSLGRWWCAVAAHFCGVDLMIY
jgi:hypothetical protein